MLLLFLTGTGAAAAFTPEALEVLAFLDARIAAAQAGQASRDAFLDALESVESGCPDWAGMRFWKHDPDLREAVLEACPELRPAPAARARSGTPAFRMAASHSVRPAGAGRTDPSLSAQGSLSLGGAEAAGSGRDFRTRRVWVRGAAGEERDSPGMDWGLQAGSLDFQPLPRLDFLVGRRTFPGSGWLSGPEGPLEVRSPALDGLGFTAGGSRGAPWEAGAFASWNRRSPSGEGPVASPRRDASVVSLAGGLTAGSWLAAAQAVQIRLETAGAAPVTAWAAGGILGPASGRLQMGAAVSALWPRGGPWDGSEPAAEAPSGLETPETTAGSPETGAEPTEIGGYGEVVLSDGKPGRYQLEWRQATPGWAAPLSAAPALLRDTVGDALILPGRGEGGLRARTRMDILEADAAAPLGISLTGAGEAAWDPEGPLAGDGRLNLALVRGPWSLEAGTGLRWRRSDLIQPGSHRAGSAALAWSPGPWRARAALSRRVAGKDHQESWPLSAETSLTGKDGDRWKVELRLEDAARPSREATLSIRQGWKLGEGFALNHSLRLPWEGGEPGRDLGYQVRLEYAAR